MDLWLVVVAAVLVVAVPFDWWTAARIIAAAVERPRVRFLSFVALVVGACALAASAFGILGIQLLWLAVTGDRLLPPPIPTVIIALGAIVISIPNVLAVRWLRIAGA